MLTGLNFTSRTLHPLFLVALIASACNTMAAERVVFNGPAPAGLSRAPNTYNDGIMPSINARLNVHDVELSSVLTKTYSSGAGVTRYDQTFNGVPVLGHYITETRSSANAQPVFLGGLLRKIANDIPSVKPKYSNIQAHSKCMAISGTDKRHRIANNNTKLYVTIDANNHAFLAWNDSYLDIDSPSSSPSRPTCLIDANTGDLISNFNAIQYLNATGPGGNSKTGLYEYDYPTPLKLNYGKASNGPYNGARFGPLVVTSDCTMQSDNVVAIDYSSRTGAPFKFACSRNTYKSINEAYSPINDAYYAANMTFNMYRDYLGKSRDEILPSPGVLRVNVHVGDGIDSAHWDGRSINLGDGAGRFYPLVSIDVVAHEISHAFTEKYSGMGWRNNYDGAMNEAFSDMAGEALKFYLRGTNDFKPGFDVTKGSGSFRYMEKPSTDGNSVDTGLNFDTGLNAHYGSGVYNRAFYVLANTAGWSTRKAFEVMADANEIYWGLYSNFATGACAVELAAINRGYPKADVTAAFSSVDVTCTGNPDSDRGATPIR